MGFDGSAACLEGQVFMWPDGATLHANGTGPDIADTTVVSLGSSNDLRFDDGVMPLDLVRVSGQLTVEMTCPSHSAPFSELPAETPCPEPLAIIAFDNAAIEVLETSRAWDTCSRITLADLLSDQAAYNWQVMCTDGLVQVHDLRPHLTSAAERTPLQSDNTLGLTTALLPQSSIPVLGGEELSAAGVVNVDPLCLEGDYGSAETDPFTGQSIDSDPGCNAIDLIAYAVSPSDRPDPWQLCRQVSIRDLLSSPLDFEGKLVCVDGLLAAPRYETAHNADASLSDGARARIIDAWRAASVPMDDVIEAQAPHTFVGIIDVWEECIRHNQAVEGGTADGGRCTPYIEIEIVDVRL